MNDDHFHSFWFSGKLYILKPPYITVKCEGEKKAEKRSIILKGGIKQNGMDIYQPKSTIFPTGDYPQMDINSSHLSFFKVEANKYATLCTESFYGRDYCPPETEQTPLSKPHLGTQTSITPRGDSLPILKHIFSLSLKVQPNKAPRQPGQNHTGRCEHSAGGRVNLFQHGNNLQKFPKK